MTGAIIKPEAAVATAHETTSAAAILQVIAAAAENPNVDVDKMDRLLQMYERVMARQAEQAFAAAMSDAQKEMRPVVRDAENSHTRSRYARLEAVDAAIRPVYTRHGFALSFDSAPAGKPDAVKVTCRVLHRDGHAKDYQLEGDLDISGSQGKANKTSIQGLGSSVSYLRRYLTLMIFNVSLTNEDNDGNTTTTIDESQLSVLTNIEAAIEETVGKEQARKIHEAFLGFMNVTAMDLIPRGAYEKAYTALSGKLRKLREAK